MPGRDRWALDVENLDELKSLLATKRCDYQLVEGRDLYCSAASAGDPTVVGTSGLSRIAPTATPICVACTLPDATVLCSHLLHPEVVGSDMLDGTADRQLNGALCDRGRSEIADPARCHVAGHDCWERVVREERGTPIQLPPLAIPDALDGLDAVWRATTDRSRRLLSLRSVTASAALAQPVIDRDTFRNRVDGLADVISNLNITDDDLDESDRPSGSINRLAAALHRRDVDGDATAALVAPLRAVNGLRRALTHSGAANQGPRYAAALGIDWPPSDWPSAWTRVQHRTIDALRELRQALDAGGGASTDQT